MNQLFIFLLSDDAANNFAAHHFSSFSDLFPDTRLVFLQDEAALKSSLPEIQWIDTWYFDQSWYALAPNLQAVFTPAAGKDWVHEDPGGRVPTYYGKFHGPMIAESMLGLMLHFNRNITSMTVLQRQKVWNRNAQKNSRLLRNQTALIVGYGNIGKSCGKILTRMGMEVQGFQRRHNSGIDADTGVQYIGPAQLDTALESADHVIVLLPGDETTICFMSRQRLAKMKPSAYLYNFGRGTTIGETDLLWALDHALIAGAGLDVTEVEPLPEASPLWRHDKVVLMPHSACVFEEYQALHIKELEFHLDVVR